MRKKVLKIIVIFLIVVLFTSVVSNYYKNYRIQAKIVTDFGCDYGNLIIGILNQRIQTDEDAIHNYDAQNTKYGYRLVELYPYNSYLQHPKFNDIIMLLDQASGCDALYEINMNKVL